MTAVRSRPARVLLVNTSYPPIVYGGAELSVAELASELVVDGLSVGVCCLTPHSLSSTARSSSSDNAPIVFPVPSRALAGWGKRRGVRRAWWHVAELLRVREVMHLRRTIRAFKPDLIHLNNMAGFGWLAWFATRRYPTVQTCRDYYFVCTSATGAHNGVECNRSRLPCRVLKSPFLLHFIRPDLVVGVSKYIANRMAAHSIVGALSSNSHVYNLPAVSDREIADRRTGASNTAQYVLGFLGRLDADKGLDIIHAAVRTVLQEGKDIQLRIAGSRTTLLDELMTAYASEYRMGAIVYVGYANSTEFVCSVDTLVVPTQWAEPFGRVAAEAIQLGIPLVASASGGLEEMDQAFGGRVLTVDRYDRPEAWASAINRVLANNWATNEPIQLPESPATLYARKYVHLVAARCSLDNSRAKSRGHGRDR